MPHLHVPVPNMRERGPIVHLKVGIGRAAESALLRTGSAVPTPVDATGLIDTGSARSVLKKGLPSELGLTPVGAVEIDTPSSMDLEVLEYLVQFWFEETLGLEAKALEAPLPVAGLRVLIGRDILSHGRLIYNGRREEFRLDF